MGGFVVDTIYWAMDKTSGPGGNEDVPVYLVPAMEALAVVGAFLPPDVLHNTLAYAQSVPHGEAGALAVACALEHMGTAQEQPTVRLKPMHRR